MIASVRLTYNARPKCGHKTLLHLDNWAEDCCLKCRLFTKILMHVIASSSSRNWTEHFLPWNFLWGNNIQIRPKQASIITPVQIETILQTFVVLYVFLTFHNVTCFKGLLLLFVQRVWCSSEMSTYCITCECGISRWPSFPQNAYISRNIPWSLRGTIKIISNLGVHWKKPILSERT